MAGRPRAGRVVPRRELTIQAVHRLITGRGWFFVMDPPAFANDAEALATYRQIRPVLLLWCHEHLRGAVPWAESLYTGKLVPTTTTEHHGFTLDSCRAFLEYYYQAAGTDAKRVGTVRGPG